MGKVTYRVTNWKTYNESLVRRGSLTMWVDQDLIENWNHPPKEPVRRGCPRKYHPDVLLLSLVIRYRFGLPYRQTEGFLASLLRLMGSDLQVPDYSYLCKQVAKLGLEFEKASSAKEIAIDSSGLKVAGEGEWKVRGHGTSKRRVWKKIHISVDVTSKEILAVEMTDSNIHDSEVFEKLLSTHCEVIYADGAYDQNRIYDQASHKSHSGLCTCVTPNGEIDMSLSAQEWVELDQAVIWHPYTQHQVAPKPLPIVRAKGAYLYDADGVGRFDGISSWWCNLLLAFRNGYHGDPLGGDVFESWPASRVFQKMALPCVLCGSHPCEVMERHLLEERATWLYQDLWQEWLSHMAQCIVPWTSFSQKGEMISMTSSS